MKVKGSITIYLSMILISVMLLVNVIGESARISAVQAQIKSYTYMSAESALAGYGRQVYFRSLWHLIRRMPLHVNTLLI